MLSQSRPVSVNKPSNAVEGTQSDAILLGVSPEQKLNSRTASASGNLNPDSNSHREVNNLRENANSSVKDAIDVMLANSPSMIPTATQNSPKRRGLERFGQKEQAWLLTPTRLATFDEIQKGDSPRSPSKTLAGAIAQWDPENEERLRKEANEKVSKWSFENMQRRQYMAKRHEEEQRRIREEDEAARVMAEQQTKIKSEEHRNNLIQGQKERHQKRQTREQELHFAAERLEALEKMVTQNPPLYVRKMREYEALERHFEKLKLEEIKELKSIPIRSMNLDANEGRYLEARQAAFEQIKAERAKDKGRLLANEADVKRFSKDRSRWLSSYVGHLKDEVKEATHEEQLRRLKEKQEHMKLYGNMRAKTFKEQQAELGHDTQIQTIPNHPPFKAGFSTLGQSIINTSSPSRSPKKAAKASEIQHEVYEIPSPNPRVHELQELAIKNYPSALQAVYEERQAGLWRNPLSGIEVLRSPEEEARIFHELNYDKARYNDYLRDQSIKRREKLDQSIENLKYEKFKLVGGGDVEKERAFETRLQTLESELKQREPIALTRGSKEFVQHLKREQELNDAYVGIINSKLNALNNLVSPQDTRVEQQKVAMKSPSKKTPQPTVVELRSSGTPNAGKDDLSELPEFEPSRVDPASRRLVENQYAKDLEVDEFSGILGEEGV
eukprot:GDKJ01013715.1.p1 GENE.GDKJ01013715.1~~GDKJ01013715.1.p1  ORF type:complete len:670 (-),score=155.68 GDKJ01013715.1:89-2098(-)